MTKSSSPRKVFFSNFTARYEEHLKIIIFLYIFNWSPRSFFKYQNLVIGQFPLTLKKKVKRIILKIAHVMLV